MDYALEERIGNPDLFTGRKEELAYFLKWINDIKERKSRSTAILARRKMGKNAAFQRPFPFSLSDPRSSGMVPRQKGTVKKEKEALPHSPESQNAG